MSARYRTLVSAVALLGASCATDANELHDEDDEIIAIDDASSVTEDASSTTEGTPDAQVDPADAQTPVDADAPDGSVPLDAALPDAESEPDATVSSGLPCEVEAVLATHCQRCHGASAKNGVSLMDREGLLAMSAKEPTMTIGERVLARMASVEAPMPPKGPPVGEEDRALVELWVIQGMPESICAK